MTTPSEQPDTSVDPTAGLAKIRLRHKVLVGIFIAYIPVLFLFYFLRFPQWLILGCAIFLVLVGVAIAFVIGLTVCPACGQLFHVRGMGGSIFTGSCMHCGISLKQQR